MVKVKEILRYLAILAAITIELIPVAWCFFLSFKPYAEWRVSYFVPKSPTLNNYVILFNPEEMRGIMGKTAIVDPVIEPFIRSMSIAAISTILAVIIGFFTVYGASRYKTSGTFSLYFTLMSRMAPPACFVTPIMVYYATLRLLDTHIGLILLYTASTLTYAIWLLKGYIDEIPVEWEEAAVLEGATTWQVMRHVLFPLVKGGLVVVALFIFLLSWAELLFALVLTNLYAVTLPVHISKYVGAIGQLYGPQAALGLVASITPVVIGYLIQKHLITGFTFGKVR